MVHSEALLQQLNENRSNYINRGLVMQQAEEIRMSFIIMEPHLLYT